MSQKNVYIVYDKKTNSSVLEFIASTDAEALRVFVLAASHREALPQLPMLSQCPEDYDLWRLLKFGDDSCELAREYLGNALEELAAAVRADKHRRAKLGLDIEPPKEDDISNDDNQPPKDN